MPAAVELVGDFVTQFEALASSETESTVWFDEFGDVCDVVVTVLFGGELCG